MKKYKRLKLRLLSIVRFNRPVKKYIGNKSSIYRQYVSVGSGVITYVGFVYNSFWDIILAIKS